MVCRDFILPEDCKLCLFLFTFQFAKLIVPYPAKTLHIAPGTPKLSGISLIAKANNCAIIKIKIDRIIPIMVFAMFNFAVGFSISLIVISFHFLLK